MATKRGNLLENLRAAIEAVGLVTKAELNSVRVLHSLTGANLPFVNINTSCQYNEAQSGTGSTRQNMDLAAELFIITTADNAEEIRGDIKVAIEADKTRGGNAANTIYEGDTTRVDPEIMVPAGAQTLMITLKMVYLVSEGAKI